MLKLPLALLVTALAAFSGAGAPNVLIVVGAAGEDEFGQTFDQWDQQWQDACAKGGARAIRVGGTTNDFELIRSNLVEASANQTDEFWLVLIGHGTFDGKEPRFNLRKLRPDWS